jgi:hypothetical protein
MSIVSLSGKPMKVWPDTKPFTEVARNRTQPRIAGMRIVTLITVKINLVSYQQEIVSIKLASEYYTFPGRNMFSHQVASSL